MPIDQMISAQPEMVPQISGRLTVARVWGATVFLDHLSRHVYIHLMQDQTQASRLEAKAAYEQHAGTCGVKIKSYCADMLGDKGCALCTVDKGIPRGIPKGPYPCP